MSLTREQEDATRKELRENLEKSGVEIPQIAADLGTTEGYIEQLLRLEPKRLEDTWILKNYLLDRVRDAGKAPTAFTALGGDYRKIWFLNAAYIDGKRITTRHKSPFTTILSMPRRDNGE